MQLDQYITNKYVTVVDCLMEKGEIMEAVDVIDRLAEFYLCCNCPAEEEDWK